LVLPAARQARGLWPAVGPETAEPKRPLVVDVGNRRGDFGRPRRRLRVPRPDPASARNGRGAAQGDAVPRTVPGTGGEVMNVFVADPEWSWWIIGYFFLGGIAAGAYFNSAIIDLFGRPEDRPLARIGYLIAVPLILICAVFLTLDLHQPT